MTKLVLDLKKSVEENAAVYFEKAKKIKRKIVGAERAIGQSKKLFDELKNKIDADNKEIEKQKAIKRKKEWYENFRWFISSEGFLVIGGRDATSNEIVIKKHTEPSDLVFHTDIAGSPFFIVKKDSNPEKEVGLATIQETADATCTFSRAWKLGLQTTSVFYVKPEQVSKKTKAGEYIGKGAFMIYGKTNYVENKINLAVGAYNENRVMSGPLESIKIHCEKYIELAQGNDKPSDVAKYIKHKIGGTIDEIIRALPGGSFKVKLK